MLDTILTLALLTIPLAWLAYSVCDLADTVIRYVSGNRAE